MKKTSLILMLFASSFATFAQEDGSTLEQPKLKPLEFAWTQDDIGEFSAPVSYVHQRQADVMYYVTVWRKIDLREKLNHPLYFPTFPQGSLRSLATLILDAVDLENLDNADALPIYDNEYCQNLKARSEIVASMSETQSVPETDDYGNILGYQDVTTQFGSSQVMSYKIKELWFFDKERSLLDVRILEIEPIVEYVPKMNLGDDAEDLGEDFVAAKATQRSLGAIKYEELRPFLAKQEAFNIKNNAARISYDDLLTWKRQFASFVTAEQNVYDNRLINEYIANPRDQIIESDRIKNEIRTMESDLWKF